MAKAWNPNAKPMYLCAEGGDTDLHCQGLSACLAPIVNSKASYVSSPCQIAYPLPFTLSASFFDEILRSSSPLTGYYRLTVSDGLTFSVQP